MADMTKVIDDLCALCASAAAALPSQEGIGSGGQLFYTSLSQMIRQAAIHANEADTAKLEAALATIEPLSRQDGI